MDSIFCCEYHSKGKTALTKKDHSHFDQYEIIQTLCDFGQVVIHDKVYPMTKGSLYFINGSDSHYALPKNEEDYMQSSILISKDFMNSLSGIVGCKEEIQNIFSENGGFYLPLKHFKTVDIRFRKISSIYKSINKFSKALFVSELIPLLNYAVYVKNK
jgi:hypothetical protein